MKRDAMNALVELEDALVDAGVPEDGAAELVDSFEAAVEECLDELPEDVSDEEDDEPDTDGGEDEGEGDGSDEAPESTSDKLKKAVYRLG